MQEIEVWVKVDEQGSWEVGTDADNCAERFTENVGDEASYATRLVLVKLRIPLPKVIEVSAEIPDEPSEVEISVK